MDSLQRFLSESVNNNSLISKNQMDMVSSEISAAIQQVIVNGAALLSFSQPPPPQQQPPPPIPTPEKLAAAVEPPDPKSTGTKIEVVDEDDKDYEAADCDIVEMDAVELLAEHIHFCEICGKGFKRDANLRMHMRAHGNQFKTPEALAKPDNVKSNELVRKMRFSCPFEGCNRNKKHKKFRPLKSVICVRNHFKRSHCPKMYSCNRCHKKSFSVVADLKSHLKHCGESKWKCSCGTSFSRKDKLFGHMALFEGHMPAVEEESEKMKSVVEVVPMEEDEEEENMVRCGGGGDGLDDGFFEGLLDGFGSMESYCLQDVLGTEFCDIGQV